MGLSPLALGFGAIAFIIGSIPFGLVVGRVLFRSDIRAQGSGNIGAANAMRSYGKVGGALVLLLDSLKGFVAAYFIAGMWTACTTWFLPEAAFLGLCSVLGHCFSPWLKFKGGKGVATYLGALFAVSWIAGLAFVAVWILLVFPTRFASLGSLVSSITSVLTVWLLTHNGYATLFCGLAVLVIVWKHRENIARLAAGTENKIGFKRSTA
ncbi:MAG: glycerol-3-phosphate 1-O-acyltransferase PlsY [Candidatus Eremiobacteraeota bacterium]|nr:glycerol-3-phosphate 1-O-acyltransferase PlsY [Candidatus Eremiobacteraeota bacterium]